MINRRSFLKTIGVGLAALATPKTLAQIEPVTQPKAIPSMQMLEMALSNFSIMRLDSLGIQVSGLCEIKDADEWREEVLQRCEGVLWQA